VTTAGPVHLAPGGIGKVIFFVKISITKVNRVLHGSARLRFALLVVQILYFDWVSGVRFFLGIRHVGTLG
jgi:hypothetical protein